MDAGLTNGQNVTGRRRCFTVDMLRQAKSLEKSQTCDSRLLKFMECCLPLVLPLLAFAKCGWSLQ